MECYKVAYSKKLPIIYTSLSPVNKAKNRFFNLIENRLSTFTKVPLLLLVPFSISLLLLLCIIDLQQTGRNVCTARASYSSAFIIQQQHNNKDYCCCYSTIPPPIYSSCGCHLKCFNFSLLSYWISSSGGITKANGFFQLEKVWNLSICPYNLCRIDMTNITRESLLS